jgi:small subunit ribosomal protein S4
MIRKKKIYVRPRKPFEAARIADENVLLKKYGLKNKREVWKTLAKVNYYRRRAKTLAKASNEDQQVFFNKLKNMGLKINSTADVLGLKVEDLLKRRLPSIVVEKGLANTVKHARQMVVHKKIIVGSGVVNSPSYIVSVSEEGSIKIKKKKSKHKQADPQTNEENNVNQAEESKEAQEVEA